MKTYKELQKGAFDALKTEFGYTNIHQVPKLDKIIIAAGTAKRARTNYDFHKLVNGRLALITGQKPAERKARMSIAGFKLRTGDLVGYMVTLRGLRKESFFDKLVNIVLPRTKDFRGIDSKSIDAMGNMTFGIKEHTVFPETGEEDLKDVFGLQITMVTTASSKKEAIAYLTYLGFPFKKVVVKAK